MRPIDADALIPLIQEDKIEEKTLGIMKALGDGLQAETLNQTCDRHIKIISSLPTIDAVPVTRCRDCKHRQAKLGDCYGNAVVLCKDGLWRDMEFFCADGERNEE